jgi:predicted nucleic acid-binding protein
VIAVDTNVVVRLLTGDNAQQAARAVALFKSEEIWLSKTVILETEWVLRSLYRFSGAHVSAALLGSRASPKCGLKIPSPCPERWDRHRWAWISRTRCTLRAGATAPGSSPSMKSW